MSRLFRYLLVWLALLALALGACAGAAPDATQPMPGESTPSEGELVEGEAFVQSTEVIVMESFPIQVALIVSGETPTPCHELRTQVEEPDEENRIQVRIYTLVDPEEVCIQVLAPFEERVSIPMAGAEDGDYTIWVNGEKAGEFSYPGG